MNGTAGALMWRTVDQFVVEPLVVLFAMVVRYEIREGPPKMAFTERDHAVKTFFSDRAHEPLRMGIAVRRQERRPNHANACGLKEALDGGAPLPVAIANQHAMPAQQPVDVVGQIAHRLDDERLVRMPR
jgi:hypothetical protein